MFNQHLVQLGLACHQAYTDCLSTWWSPTGLMEIVNLEIGFPLRCFQRLSIRNVATLQCA